MKKLFLFLFVIGFFCLFAEAAFQTTEETPLTVIFADGGVARNHLDSFLTVNPAGLALEEKYIFASWRKYLFTSGVPSENIPGYILADISQKYLAVGGWPVVENSKWRLAFGAGQMSSPAYSEVTYLFGSGGEISLPTEDIPVRVGLVLKIFQLRYSSNDYAQDYFVRYGETKSAITADAGLQYQFGKDIFAVVGRNLIPADVGLLETAFVPAEISFGYWHDFSYLNLSTDLVYRQNNPAGLGLGVEIPLSNFLKIAGGISSEKFGAGIVLATKKYSFILSLVNLYQMENSGSISSGFKFLW